MLDQEQHEARARFDAQEKYVTAIIRRRRSRGEAVEASRGRSPLPTLLDQLQNHANRPPSDSLRSTTPTDSHAWIMTVDCALAEIGFIPAFVVVARCTRPAKSASRAWEQIQREAKDIAESRGIDVPHLGDVQQMYQISITFLSMIFELRGLAVESPTLESLRIKCAAIASGLACPVGIQAVA